jgi:hypothetical protein
MTKENRNVGDIATGYVDSIESLRILTDEIARLADAHDRDRARRLASDVLRWLGESDEVIANFERQSVALDLPLEIIFDADKAVSEEDAAPLVDRVTEIISRYPQKSAEIRRIVRDIRRAAARQGQLLRRGAITLLVSFVEGLLADLVRFYYVTYPEALTTEAHALTLAELRRLGSIADAEQLIAAKEAECLLRESFDAQLKFFRLRLKVPLEEMPCVIAMTEVMQRRNVIVHNNAIVNGTYVQKSPRCFIEQHAITEGSALLNSPEYIREAISSAVTLGFVLIQNAWRKWSKDHEQADMFAIRQIYDLLVARSYETVIAICVATEGLDLKVDQTRRIVIVNHAIALKHLDRLGDMNMLLDGVDWSASSLRFRTVLAAIREDIADFEDLGPRALASGELSR